MLLQDIVGIEAIVNEGAVHTPYDEQLRWIEETYKKYEIENLIIVGGESSRKKYPGPTVNETLDAITKNLNDNSCNIFAVEFQFQVGVMSQKI